MTFWVRITTYIILPLLLAALHLAWDRQARTRQRAIELFLLYIFGISIGANGIGGFFGHLFLSDIVAESIGWPAGNPFQQEVGFANLAIGILGFMAMNRRNGVRLATAVAVATFAYGATIVHLMDIIATGNLAPGNTIQNISNLVRPTSVILLLYLAHRAGPESTVQSRGLEPFAVWREQQLPPVTTIAIALSAGFGLGFAIDQPWLGVLGGLLVSVALGLMQRRRIQALSPPA